MFRLIYPAFILAIFSPIVAPAQESDFTLSAPAALGEIGFLEFLMPRFSLKTGIKAEINFGAGNTEMQLTTDTGILVFEGRGTRYFMAVSNVETPGGQKAQRFADWLISSIGKRTIEQFSIDGAQVFTAAQPTAQVADAIVFEGDVTRGETLSYANCGRCHVIGDRNRMQGIGSTPSFGVMRGLPDWDDRFMTFFQRNPHPAFIQVEGITFPFDPSRPPTIVPIIISESEFEDILTFVSTIEPVDLGAPLVEHQ